MELEKSESVLGSLYALRGGLSAISVERDKARLADEECFEKLKAVAGRVGLEHGADKDDEENENSDKTLKYCEWLCGDEPEKLLNRTHSELLDEVKEKEIIGRVIRDDKSRDYVNKIDENYYSAKKDFIIMGGCLAVFLALIITGSVLIALSKPNSEGEAFAIICYLFCAAPFITAMVFLGYGVGNKKSQKYYTETLKEYQKSLQEQRVEEAARCAELRKAEEISVAERRKSIEDNYKDLLDVLIAVKAEARKLIEERNAVIKPLAESCEAYHKALTAQFTPLLDERDWQHLDLVIYQLETRRADSIKEALQLVDRELQTERLESSIGVAIKSISYTLAHGFTALQESIRKNCTELSGRLQDTNLQLSAAVGQISAANRQLEAGSARLVGVSEKLAELSDSVNVGNALQEKANETSAQLMDDIHEIKYYNIDRVV
ncbi:MAG: hypothetical protein NC033_00155 [Clostridiales bacterium]|nr:hypothetical protein [Clostridiales bacterium]